MASTNVASLSVDQLKRAVQIKEEITRLENELGRVLGGSGSAGATRTGGGRGVISAEGRARIAAAQRARWAKARGNGNKAAGSNKPAAKSGPRKMSPAARAKIAAAARARWAKVKAGK